MKHITFGSRTTEFKLAILIKDSAFDKNNVFEHYIKPIRHIVSEEDIIVFSLNYNEQNKAPSTLVKKVLNNISMALDFIKTYNVLIADSTYFKTFCHKSKAEPHLGSVIEHAYLGYSFNSFLIPNYQSLFHNPNNQSKIELVLNKLIEYFNNTYTVIGNNIIKNAQYLYDYQSIKKALISLLDKLVITFDIETKGLHLSEADIVSISFAYSQHEGIAFLVDDFVKHLIRDFFIEYRGIKVAHNASFDIRNIIYRCFMTNPLDIKNMLNGLHTMYRNLEDTKIITYLATNSTSGNDLSLKNNAFEFAGNWAIEIEDASTIEPQELLKYNLIDCLSTFYLFNKYTPVMIKDNQEHVYRNIMLPSLKTITQMELIGMPMEGNKINKLEEDLNIIANKHKKFINNHKLIKQLEWSLKLDEWKSANEKLKKKVRSLDEFNPKFNPNSGKQVQKLLYDQLGFEVISTTDTGQPSTDGDTLETLYKKLINEYGITEDDLR